MCSVMCLDFVCLCACVGVGVCLWYLCCLALLKESQGDISLNRVHEKGSAPPRLCVQGGECLCGVGLSEKSWLVKFVFCSLYTSSQLRDKTDKSTPPLSPPHLPLLESPFIFLLCWVSSLSPSSLPLPFTILC